MTASPSEKTWRRVIRQAKEGAPRHLLELLLHPTTTDGRGNPLPGSFVDLPDDGVLRYDIVRALIFNDWKGAAGIGDLMTKTGWGKGKPSVSELEVSAAALYQQEGANEDRMASLAQSLGITLETLHKRIAKQRKAKRT